MQTNLIYSYPCLEISFKCSKYNEKGVLYDIKECIILANGYFRNEGCIYLCFIFSVVVAVQTREIIALPTNTDYIFMLG